MAAINDARVREILTASPTVAVLGIHREPEKAAFYVPEYLHDAGYRVIGVNPKFVDETLFGEKVRSTLREISEPIDLVDVFRRTEHIPLHVEEAALVDGWSRFQAFRKVVLPLAAPGIVATAIFTFVLAWNEFLFAFMFTSEQAKTAPVAFVGIILRETGVEWNLMAAGAGLLMLPTLALSWVIQRYFVQGLGLGAVKG